MPSFPRPLPPPQEELAEHGDIVIVRGPDTYMDLPNKTFRMLRFGHAHPTGLSILFWRGEEERGMGREPATRGSLFPSGRESSLLETRSHRGGGFRPT